MPKLNKEKNELNLNSSLAKNYLGWEPILSQEEAISRTATWYKGWMLGENSRSLMLADLMLMNGGEW